MRLFTLASCRFYYGMAQDHPYILLHVRYGLCHHGTLGTLSSRCHTRLSKSTRALSRFFLSHSLLYALLLTPQSSLCCPAVPYLHLFQAGASPRVYMSHASICVGKDIPVFPQLTLGHKPADSLARHAPFQRASPSHPLHSLHDTSS